MEVARAAGEVVALEDVMPVRSTEVVATALLVAAAVTEGGAMRVVVGMEGVAAAMEAVAVVAAMAETTVSFEGRGVCFPL